MANGVFDPATTPATVPLPRGAPGA